MHCWLVGFSLFEQSGAQHGCHATASTGLVRMTSQNGSFALQFDLQRKPRPCRSSRRWGGETGSKMHVITERDKGRRRSAAAVLKGVHLARGPCRSRSTGFGQAPGGGSSSRAAQSSLQTVCMVAFGKCRLMLTLLVPSNNTRVFRRVHTLSFSPPDGTSCL